MSTGLALGLVGGALGSMVGLGSLGFAIGSAIGAQYDKPDTEGPRMSDRKSADSQYGLTLPQVWGAYRVPGTLIWCMPELREVITEADQGKGGGPKSITYAYYFTGAVAICQAPDEGINGIGRIWINGKVIFDARPGRAVITFGEAADNIGKYMRLHKGQANQPRDPRMEAESPNCSAYRNVAYIFFDELPLGPYNNQFPNLEIEALVGRPAVTNETFAIPELLHYLDDAGSQAGLRPLMIGNVTDIMYSMHLNHGAPEDSWTHYAHVFGKAPKLIGGNSSQNLPSFANPQVFYGNKIKYDTPALQIGLAGMTDFSVKSVRPAYGIWRRAGPGTLDSEAIIIADLTVPLLLYNTKDQAQKMPNQPAAAIAAAGQLFYIIHTHENIIYRNGQDFPIVHEFPENERVHSWAPAAGVFYVATVTDSSAIRIYEFDEHGRTGLEVLHHAVGTDVRLHCTRDGRVYSSTHYTGPSLGPGSDDLLEICVWSPATTDAFERVGLIAHSFVVGPSDHLDDAPGKTARLVTAGSGPGRHGFFWTDGMRCVFDAGIGGGNNDGVGGDGIAGAVLDIAGKFGAAIEPPTAGEIITGICRLAHLEDDMFDTSELEEDVHGYMLARSATARAAMDPLRDYYPFDAIDSGDKLYFRKRGRDVSVTITEEDMGVEIASA